MRTCAEQPGCFAIIAKFIYFANFANPRSQPEPAPDAAHGVVEAALGLVDDHLVAAADEQRHGLRREGTRYV